MFRIGIYLFAACGVLSLSGCALALAPGQREVRQVSGLDSVVLAGMGDLTITQGDRETLVVFAARDVLPEITTEVRDGTLIIDFRRNAPTRISSRRPIRYELTVRSLQRVELTGIGNVRVEGLDGERLTMALSGSGSLVGKDLDLTELDVRLAAAGSCEAHGRVQRQTCVLTGAGSYNARGLKSQEAVLTLSGMGSATVSASETLGVSITGMGSVDYYGDPQVTQTITGLGSVQRRGRR